MDCNLLPPGRRIIKNLNCWFQQFFFVYKNFSKSIEFINKLSYNYLDPQKEGKYYIGGGKIMDQIIAFVVDLKELVIKIFDLVDLIMGKVDEYTAEDAE